MSFAALLILKVVREDFFPVRIDEDCLGREIDSLFFLIIFIAPLQSVRKQYKLTKYKSQCFSYFLLLDVFLL